MKIQTWTISAFVLQVNLDPEAMYCLQMELVDHPYCNPHSMTVGHLGKFTFNTFTISFCQYVFLSLFTVIFKWSGYIGHFELNWTIVLRYNIVYSWKLTVNNHFIDRWHLLPPNYYLIYVSDVFYRFILLEIYYYVTWEPFRLIVETKSYFRY